MEIHYNIKCEGCGIEPIYGGRYCTSEYPGFDFCTHCWVDNNHGHYIDEDRKMETKKRIKGTMKRILGTMT